MWTGRRRCLVGGLLALVLAANCLLRLRLVDVPLERDEGEYAYAGQLMLDGVAPYTQAYNMKLPGIYAAYALILAIFGETHRAIHIGLLLVNAATVVVLFFLSRKMFGDLAAIGAACAFAVLSVGASVQGVFANAEHFVILPACAGLFVLVSAKERDRLWPPFVGGVLLGLGFLMKQHGMAFVVFGALYLSVEGFQRKLPHKRLVSKSLLYGIGAALPFLVTCALLVKAGVFGKFWFWSYRYAREYVSTIPFSDGVEILGSRIGPITGSARLIWVLAAIGVLATVFRKGSGTHRLFAIGFAAFSVVAICPGFYFRPHYFVLLLPAVAILAGVGGEAICRLFGSARSSILAVMVPALLWVAVVGESVYKEREYLFSRSATQVSRQVYGSNPFPESLVIGRYIKEQSEEGAEVAILGSEPQIYFYSNRRSASGYIYTYALMESHPFALTMQEDMIREIEESSPEFIVFVNVRTSWLLRPGSSDAIFRWFENYIRDYDCVAVVDVLGFDQTNYVWGEGAKSYTPASGAWLKVYRSRRS